MIDALAPDGMVVGIDVGGTRTKSGLVDARANLHAVEIGPTEHERGFTEVYPRLRARVRSLAATAGPEHCVGIAIALPGIAESAFGCRHLPGKLIGLEDYPLCAELEAEFSLPVRVINDGVAAALAEATVGAAAGIQDVVGFTLGTGVGSGVIVRGRPLQSGHLGAGTALGHLTIAHDGRLCLCGNRGCAETLVSATAVEARLRDALHRNVPSVLSATYASDPTAITFASLIEGLEAGDALCLEVVEQLRRDLGALVVSAIHAFMPTAVVVGGGPVAAGEHFLPAVQAHVDRHAFVYPRDRRVEVLPARLADNAGVLGAAIHLLEEIG